jgi:CheY-like chemotaxis protein
LCIIPAKRVIIPIYNQAGAVTGVAASNLTILLVEDTALLRNAVTRMLSDMGYEVAVAASAEEALALIGSGRPVDLLFTNIMLPGGIDGEELAVAVRRLCPAMPVLFASGYTERRLRNAAGGEQRNGMIAKPYTKGELAVKLRALLDRVP